MGASVHGSGRSRRRRAIAEINVVPYIDVMLVLLIIFMVTAPFVNPAVVDLPSVARTSSTPKALPVEIVIKADGALGLRTQDPKSERQGLTRQEIVAAIVDHQGSHPDTPVVISADKAVRYEQVMDMMSALHARNVQRVGLTVKQGQ